MNVQGGMGEAAAEALRSVHSGSGLGAARAFYRRLQTLPPVGGTFVHAVLDMEAAVPPAEQLPDPAVEAIFEVRDVRLASVMCLVSISSGHRALMAEVCWLGQQHYHWLSEHIHEWVYHSSSRRFPTQLRLEQLGTESGMCEAQCVSLSNSLL